MIAAMHKRPCYCYWFLFNPAHTHTTYRKFLQISPTRTRLDFKLTLTAMSNPDGAAEPTVSAPELSSLVLAHSQHITESNYRSPPSTESPPPSQYITITKIAVAAPHPNRPVHISWKVIWTLAGLMLSLYCAWGTVVEINNTLLLLGRPFTFIVGLIPSLGGFGCTYFNVRCLVPSSVVTLSPHSSVDYPQTAAVLAAKLDSEATHAVSLTAHILSFANGTAIKLLQYRSRSIQSVAREFLQSDLPDRVELYDTVQVLAEQVTAFGDQLIALNSFGSMALDFFAREFIGLEADIQRTIGDPQVETIEAIGRRVRKFVDAFSERIDRYLGIVDDAQNAAGAVAGSVNGLMKRIVENERLLREQIELKGKIYEKILQSLTLEGRHEIQNRDVLLASKLQIVEIQNDLITARGILKSMEKGAEYLKGELSAEFISSAHLKPDEVFRRFAATVVNMEKKTPEYKELFRIDL
ncbi:hypothetical protein DFH06DRAFT_1482702 [Mycena polygramma]|nr:hypothetical protein DFH06DRAFT_1482702 [Mycena polygramma]